MEAIKAQYAKRFQEFIRNAFQDAAASEFSAWLIADMEMSFFRIALSSMLACWGQCVLDILDRVVETRGISHLLAKAFLSSMTAECTHELCASSEHMNQCTESHTQRPNMWCLGTSKVNTPIRSTT